MPDGNEALFRVTDLKQYQYCPRIIYYHACLPDVRPTTYKMQAGIDAHEREKRKAARRVLESFSAIEGLRHFDVTIVSERLGLSSQIDEVIEVLKPERRLIPIDYKLSRTPGDHFKVQLTAYALLLEDAWHLPVTLGYLYLIPLRKRVEVPISRSLRNSVKTALTTMHRIVRDETMPLPTQWRQRCTGCEFRRFCNDVF
jgi:CRISPR-associated exonuclease Cas4